MGLTEKLQAKRSFYKDQTGLAPIIAGVILLVVMAGIGITALAVYNITQRPDIVYNITNPGFSLAGMGTDTVWIVVGVIGALIVLWLLLRPRK